MSKVQQKVNDIISQINELTSQGRSIISQSCVEWLNSPDNDKGCTHIVFGGHTPSFNDGEPCVFSMRDVFATNTKAEIESPDYYYLDEDECEIVTGNSSKSFKANIVDLIEALDSVGVITRLFNTYGFICIVHKDGTVEEKEYECGY